MSRASAMLLAAAVICAALLGADAVCSTSNGVDVCMAVDDSGSLGEEGYEQEKSFALTLYDNFDEDEARIAIYLFGSRPRLLVPFSSSFDEGRELLESAEAEFLGEDLGPAIAECANALRPLDNGRQKLIILMTDGGQASVPEVLFNQSTALKDQGVVLSTVGVSPISEFGPVFDETLLRGMSSPKKGGGDLFYSLTVEELPDDAAAADSAAEFAADICESGVGDVGNGLSAGAKAGIAAAGLAALAVGLVALGIKSGIIGGGTASIAKLGSAFGKGGGAAAATVSGAAAPAPAVSIPPTAASSPLGAAPMAPATTASPTLAAALAPALSGVGGAAAAAAAAGAAAAPGAGANAAAGAAAGAAAPGSGAVAGGQALPLGASESGVAASTAAAFAAAAAAASSAGATTVRTLIQKPAPCFDSPEIVPHPDSTAIPDSNTPDAPSGDKPVDLEDISNPNLPDLPPTHLSIAIDTSRLGCSAQHAGGDSRSTYASVVRKLQNALAVASIGQMQTSIVSFSGLSAEVPAAMADEPVSDDPAAILKCVAGIEPPPGADTHRASPHAAILAVNHCIHLLRTTEVRFRARRRVLVLHAGGYSDAEFKAECLRHRDGLGWKTANCVIVSGIGKEFDRAAGVQLGCVAMTCEEIESLGNKEVLRLLKSLLGAKNPRTLSSSQ